MIPKYEFKIETTFFDRNDQPFAECRNTMKEGQGVRIRYILSYSINTDPQLGTMSATAGSIDN